MGIGTLRRYHKPLTSEGVGSSSVPGAGAGAPSPDELEAAVLAAHEALAKARDASEAANTASFDAPDDEALAKAAADAADEAQAAQLTLENAQKALDEDAAAREEAAKLATKHGDLDRPARLGSTDAWIAYAKADSAGAPFDLTKRTGLRDEIAAHYLDK